MPAAVFKMYCYHTLQWLKCTVLCVAERHGYIWASSAACASERRRTRHGNGRGSLRMTRHNEVNIDYYHSAWKGNERT